ncbi:MAG: hypothetical protein ACLGGX_12465 [Bdellovibrionia bacterium]
MKSEIQEKLEQLAYERTTPFCYGCYVDAPTGVCPECHSDDLMRYLVGVGVEWGTSWVIKHILEDELTAVDADEVFEESMRQCYPEETTVGWMSFDTVDLMKSQDPISWRIARDEYFYNLESDEEMISFDGGLNYYWFRDVEELLG